MATQILQINKQDLREVFIEWREEIRAEVMAEMEAQSKEALKTAEETKIQLRTSDPTLWRWAKAGYLTPIYIGGKKMYKQSDIDAIIEGGKQV